VVTNNVNAESKCFNASICTKSAEFDRQIAQKDGWLAVVPDAREPLSPQADNAWGPAQTVVGALSSGDTLSGEVPWTCVSASRA
jgi:hypothetical protein